MNVMFILACCLSIFATSAAAPNPCDKPCTKIYDPVCGSDGEDYANKCVFDIANCKAGNTLMYTRSTCLPATVSWNHCDKGCTFNYNPVCGSNGATYANSCVFEIDNCKAGYTMTFTPGSCSGETGNIEI